MLCEFASFFLLQKRTPGNFKQTLLHSLLNLILYVSSVTRKN